MNNKILVSNLVKRYPLISDQIDKDQLLVILNELDEVLAKLDGAIVEFGCYVGTTSLFIRRMLDIRNDNREFHVYDSFEGLPEKTSRDISIAGEQFKAGELKVSKKQFLLEFKKAGLKPPVVHKAWFKDLTGHDLPDKIVFAFLDGDFYESIKGSLKLVIPRLQIGGVLIIDDYAREALPGVAKAAHEFFKPHQIRIIHNLGVIGL